MNEDRIGWKAVWDINDHFLRAAFGLGLGWVALHLYSPDFFIMGIVAYAAFLGGTIRLVKGLWKLSGLIRRDRERRSFRKKGAKPKSETMAVEADLKARGLLK